MLLPEIILISKPPFLQHCKRRISRFFQPRLFATLSPPVKPNPPQPHTEQERKPENAFYVKLYTARPHQHVVIDQLQHPNRFPCETNTARSWATSLLSFRPSSTPQQSLSAAPQWHVSSHAQSRNVRITVGLVFVAAFLSAYTTHMIGKHSDRAPYDVRKSKQGSFKRSSALLQSKGLSGSREPSPANPTDPPLVISTERRPLPRVSQAVVGPTAVHGNGVCTGHPAEQHTLHLPGSQLKAPVSHIELSDTARHSTTAQHCVERGSANDTGSPNRQVQSIVQQENLSNTFFDAREAAYYAEIAACEDALRKLDKEALDLRDLPDAASGYRWTVQLIDLFQNEDDEKLKRERVDEARRMLRNRLTALKKMCIRFKQGVPLRLGVAQLLEENHATDRYSVGTLTVHETQKFFFSSIISGTNGHQMAEYARKTLYQRVLDGLEASPLFLKQEALRLVFEKLDKDLKTLCDGARCLRILEPLNMGLYILAVLIDDQSICVSNIGNGKAIISREGIPYQLSAWHGADDLYEQRLLMQIKKREQNTVQCRKRRDVPRKMNGIFSIPFWLTGTLGFDTVETDCLIKGLAPVTRGLGHFALKEPQYGELFDEMKGSQGYPYIYGLPTSAEFPRTPFDEFLILGSNGFWEWMDPKEAVALVHRCIADKSSIPGDEVQYAQPATEVLLAQALDNYAAARSNAMKKERQSHLKEADTSALPKRHDMTIILVPLSDASPSSGDVSKHLRHSKNNYRGSVENKAHSLTQACFKWAKSWIIRDPEDVIRTADYRTKLRWLYDQH